MSSVASSPTDSTALAADAGLASPVGRPPCWNASANGHCLSFVILGASGDLAKRKIFPALFPLYVHNHLPATFKIYGYARSSLSQDEFLKKIRPGIEKISQDEWKSKIDDFLGHCTYVQGQYDNIDDIRGLGAMLDKDEGGRSDVMRVFYLSLPPDVFQPAAETIGQGCANSNSRILVEKPFGHSLESFQQLSAALKRIFPPRSIFRVDHYLTKAVIENLLVLRFGNVFLDALWNRSYIRSIQIAFTETLGVEGRGGYYDSYGVIRDILQNHCMQVLSLLCMEPPVSLEADDIRNEKVKVLRAIPPLTRDDLVIGQYRGKKGDPQSVGYTDDPSVRKDSLTPTFAACVLHIRNRRFDGVPILIKAGKALDEQKTQIRVQFHNVPGGLYSEIAELEPNELVINVQPNEGMRFKLMNKVPGLAMQLMPSGLDLLYRSKFTTRIPDAYERLIYNCLQGNRSNFVREDELDASWRIFDPVLTELERKKIKPDQYPFGSRGPSSADYLAARYGVEWHDSDDAL